MVSDYEMWLMYDGDNKRLRFPVLPDKIQVKCGSQDSSVSIVDFGEITLKQSRPAYTISFSSYFAPVAVQGGSEPQMTPKEYRDTILSFKEGDKPCHFILTGSGINLYCTIADFSWYEQGGDVGTIYFTLSLKEYREIAPRQITIEPTTNTASVSKAETRTDSRTIPATHTVVAGDTLWGIAKRYLGNGARYTEIVSLNTDVIKNPSLIVAGMVLKLPTGAQQPKSTTSAYATTQSAKAGNQTNNKKSQQAANDKRKPTSEAPI